MFKTHFLSNDISKVDEYRIYSTKLNKFKSQSKTLYCCKHFNLSKNNMNLTRKLIGTLIRTTNSDIANQLNQYFNVGPTLASYIMMITPLNT